jgi:hypothetical protein
MAVRAEWRKRFGALCTEILECAGLGVKKTPILRKLDVSSSVEINRRGERI